MPGARPLHPARRHARTTRLHLLVLGFGAATIALAPGTAAAQRADTASFNAYARAFLPTLLLGVGALDPDYGGYQDRFDLRRADIQAHVFGGASVYALARRLGARRRDAWVTTMLGAVAFEAGQGLRGRYSSAPDLAAAALGASIALAIDDLLPARRWGLGVH